MQQEPFRMAAGILILFLTVFALSCQTTEHRSVRNDDSPPVQTLAGDEISRLDDDVIVRLTATLVKRYKGNCIELFAQDDFNEYSGDGKYAVPSRLAFAPLSADLSTEGKAVVVTGRMRFVRDAYDSSKTCGIVTGKIFEITAIEYLSR